MKKTTLLLIGAFAFVLHSATAQVTLYDDNFEGQVIGNAPQNIGGGNAGHTGAWTNAPVGQDPGGAMWNWVGGGGNGVTITSWETASALDSTGFFTTSAHRLSWTDKGNAGTYFGFSEQAHTSTAAGIWSSRSQMTLSFDVLVSGTEWAASTTPLTIWFDQFPGNIKTFDAKILPTITTDGLWNHVSFTLDNLIPSGTSGAYDPTLGIEIAFDAGTGASMMGGDTSTILLDNILLTAVPEPGTIALLTLGGLGALVAIRRRSV